MAQGQVNPRLLSRKTQHGLTGVLNEHAAVPAAQSGGFGARMLAKFGWKDGEGLGKDGQGRKEHIRVTKRAEGLGLGASAAEPSGWAPPPGSAAAAASAKRSRDSDSDSDEEDEREAEVRRRVASSGVIPGLSDEDLFAICGGARLGDATYPLSKRLAAVVAVLRALVLADFGEVSAEGLHALSVATGSLCEQTEHALLCLYTLRQHRLARPNAPEPVLASLLLHERRQLGLILRAKDLARELRLGALRLDSLLVALPDCMLMASLIAC